MKRNNWESKIDTIQRDVARRIVGGHRGCAIKAMYGELGWRDIKYELDKRLLRFLGRMWVGGVPDERWSMKVFLEGLEDIRKGRALTPWWARVSKKFDEYGLDAGLLIRKEGLQKWRTHVDKQIASKALVDWGKGMEGMSTLRYYRKKPTPKYEPYLRDDWEKKWELFRIRTGQAMLNGIRSKWDCNTEEWCVVCKEIRETEEHLLLECKGLTLEREVVMRAFEGALDERGKEEFRGLSQVDKMGWMLGLDEGVAKRIGKQTWKRIFVGIGRLLYKRDRLADKVGWRKGMLGGK